jgi:hypothetical protein
MGVSFSIQNGFLPLTLLVVCEAHVDLRPNSPRQKPFVVADVLGLDVDELVAEIVDLGPIVGINKAHLYLADKGPGSFFLDLALRLHPLVGADIVVGERVVDDLQSHLDLGHLNAA